MALPKFTAELSLSKSTRMYRGRMAYGNLAATRGAAPANIMPSQFDDFVDAGDNDETALLDEADADFAGLDDSGDADFAGLDDSGDADFADFENGEDPEVVDEGVDLEDIV
jgi:hypothetical protein